MKFLHETVWTFVRAVVLKHILDLITHKMLEVEKYDNVRNMEITIDFSFELYICALLVQWEICRTEGFALNPLSLRIFQNVGYIREYQQ